MSDPSPVKAIMDILVEAASAGTATFSTTSDPMSSTHGFTHDQQRCPPTLEDQTRPATHARSTQWTRRGSKAFRPCRAAIGYFYESRYLKSIIL